MNIKINTAWIGVGLAFAGLAAALPAFADEWNKETIFTFNEPVEVPGHVLTPGKYVFRLADSPSDRNIVQIFSEDEKAREHLITTVLAIPDYHPEVPEKPLINFEERISNTPEAIKSWFYPGDNYGWEFVYPKSERLEAVNKPAPTPPSPAVSVAAAAVLTQPAPAAIAPAEVVREEQVILAENASPQPAAGADAVPGPKPLPRQLPKTAGGLLLRPAWAPVKR